MTVTLLNFPFFDGFQGHADVEIDGIVGDLPVTGDLAITGDLTVGDDATITGTLAAAGSQAIIGAGVADTSTVLTVKAPGLDDVAFTDFYGIFVIAGNAAGTGFGEFAEPMQIQQLNTQGYASIAFLDAAGVVKGRVGYTNSAYANTGPDPSTFALWSFHNTEATAGRLALGGTNGGGVDHNYLRFDLGAGGVTLGFGFGTTAPAPRAAVAALTNNVTVGGVNDTVADYAIVDYATDAASIRNDIYQLSRKLAEVVTALRAHGILI